MFAFSQVEPQTSGLVSDMASPMSDYLSTSFDQGLHDSIFAAIWRSSSLNAAEKDTSSALLQPEEANKQFGVGDLKFSEPINMRAAQMLHDQKQAQMTRDFWLSQDNHTVLAGAAGMGTRMLSSMLNPVDFGLMFMPVVGQAEKLAEGANVLGRGALVRQFLNRGLISRSLIQETFPAAPKLAESVLQGMSYQAMAEVPLQINARQEHEDLGNPIEHILQGGLFAGGLHLALTSLGRFFIGLKGDTKQAMFQKSMDDFAKGQDINVHDLAKLDEAYWDERREQLRTQTEYENMYTRQAAVEKTPGVPETAPEPEQKQFTSVLDEIRHYGAKTREQIRRLFPEAELTSEQARDLRLQAWGEDPIAKKQANDEQWDHIQDLLDQAKKPAEKSLIEAQDAIKDGQTLTLNTIEEHTLDTTKDATVTKVEQQATQDIAITKEQLKLKAALSIENKAAELTQQQKTKLALALENPAKKLPKPEVPGTPAEERVYTSVADEIRQKGAKTRAEIQALFPEAKLSNQQAAKLRNETYGEHPEAKAQRERKEAIFEKHLEEQQDQLKEIRPALTKDILGMAIDCITKKVL